MYISVVSYKIILKYKLHIYYIEGTCNKQTTATVLMPLASSGVIVKHNLQIN